MYTIVIYLFTTRHIFFDFPKFPVKSFSVPSSFWSCLELSCSDFALVPPTHHVVFQCQVVMLIQPVCIYRLCCITTFANLACISIAVLIYIDLCVIYSVRVCLNSLNKSFSGLKIFPFHKIYFFILGDFLALD